MTDISIGIHISKTGRVTHVVMAVIGCLIFMPMLVVIMKVSESIVLFDQNLPELKGLYAVIINTLIFSSVVASISTIFALIVVFSLVLSKQVSIFFAYLALFFMLFLLPPALHYAIWMPLAEAINFNGYFTAILILTISNCAVPFFIYTYSLANTNVGYFESARVMVPDLRCFFQRVFLPLLVKPMFLSWVVVFLFVAGNAEVPTLLSLSFVANEVLALITIDGKYDLVILLSIPLFLPVLVLLFYMFRNGGNTLPTNTVKVGSVWVSQCIDLGATKNIWAAILWGALIFVVFEFAKNIPLTMEVFDFSGSIVDALCNSVFYAATASFISTTLVFFMYGWARSRKRLIVVFCTLSFFVLLIPDVYWALNLLVFKNSIWLSSVMTDEMTMLYAYICKLTPIVFLLYSVWASEDEEVVASDYYLRRLSFYQTIILFRWPLNRDKLVIIFLLGFGLLISELPLTVMFSPPGVETLVLRAYNFMHYGAWDEVFKIYAWLIMIMVMILAGVIVMWRIRHVKV